MELIIPCYKTDMAMIVETSACGLGIVLVSLVGHIFSNWVEYYVVLATTLIATIPLFIFIPRSYRWYFSQK